MRMKNNLTLLGLFIVVVFAIQYLFIASVPNLIFRLAQKLSNKPLNTVIHAPKTDAKLRKVVLPNPDFIHSACFYDVTNNDLLISGTFPDSTQYCSLAFYADNAQPYYVLNNQKGGNKSFEFRISANGRTDKDITSPTKQGTLLVRSLVTDSLQMRQALKLQKEFKVQVIE